jgi:hypothetical protein
VHYVGIVCPDENVARTTHVGSQLIHFVKAAVDYLLTEIATPQIASDEFVSFGFRKKRKFLVNSANPPSFGL